MHRHGISAIGVQALFRAWRTQEMLLGLSTAGVGAGWRHIEKVVEADGAAAAKTWSKLVPLDALTGVARYTCRSIAVYHLLVCATA